MASKLRNLLLAPVFVIMLSIACVAGDGYSDYADDDSETGWEDVNNEYQSEENNNLSDVDRMYNDIIDRANAASAPPNIQAPTKPNPLSAILKGLGYEAGSRTSRKILEDSKR